MEDKKEIRASAIRLSRREFLHGVVGVAGMAVLPHSAFSGSSEPNDEEIFNEKLALAAKEKLSGKPIGDVMATIGKSFLGVPYVGHTLEASGPEHLVVNLRGLDCLTLVENTLVLSRLVKLQKYEFADFQKQLTLVRYRSGNINSYPSRLHYFTDWISDNAAKKIVREMTMQLGGATYRKTINFMTTHTSSYKQLADTSFVREIAQYERKISSTDLSLIPKDRIAAMQAKLQNGDIIGTVTTMDGMDVSHTGLVVVDKGIPKFLHASLSGKQVMLSNGSLAEYVASIKSHTGIVIARPLEPT
jgi:hypothetical protein